MTTSVCNEPLPSIQTLIDGVDSQASRGREERTLPWPAKLRQNGPLDHITVPSAATLVGAASFQCSASLDARVARNQEPSSRIESLTRGVTQSSISGNGHCPGHITRPRFCKPEDHDDVSFAENFVHWPANADSAYETRTASRTVEDLQSLQQLSLNQGAGSGQGPSFNSPQSAATLRAGNGDHSVSLKESCRLGTPTHKARKNAGKKHRVPAISSPYPSKKKDASKAPMKKAKAEVERRRHEKEPIMIMEEVLRKVKMTEGLTVLSKNNSGHGCQFKKKDVLTRYLEATMDTLVDAAERDRSAELGNEADGYGQYELRQPRPSIRSNL